MHISKLLAALEHAATHQNTEVWVVGGAIRDRLLGLPLHDLDVAVAGDAVSFARAVADATDGSFVLLGDAHGTARVVWGAREKREAAPAAAPGAGLFDRGTAAQPDTLGLDVAQLRTPTIEDDLRLRDWTINALALPLAAAAWLGSASAADAAGSTANTAASTVFSAGVPVSSIVDPCGGLADLAARRLRPCSAASLPSDPVRLLRGARLMAQFGFAVDEATRTALHDHAALIRHSATERTTAELLRLLALPHAAAALTLLDDTGILTTLLPALEPSRTCDQPGGYHFLPVLAHMLEAVRCYEWIEAVALPGSAGTLPADADPPAAVREIPALGAPLAYSDEIRARMDETVDGIPRRALFKLALLLHDIAKPQTKQLKPNGGVSFHDHQLIGADMALNIARGLRISKAGGAYVHLVVREHMRPGQLAELGDALSKRAVHRFWRDVGDAGPEVLVHMMCDYMAMRGPLLNAEHWLATVGFVNELLERRYATPETVLPPPLVNGRDLLDALHLPPGPQIGSLLTAIREAQAEGEVATPEQALALAKKLLNHRWERTESTD